MKRLGIVCVAVGGLATLGSITRYVIYLATRGPRDPMATEGETLSYTQFQQVLTLIGIGVVLLGVGAYLLSRTKVPNSHEVRP